MPHPVVLGLVDDVGPMVQLLTGHSKWGRDLSKPIGVGEGTGNGRLSFSLLFNMSYHGGKDI